MPTKVKIKQQPQVDFADGSFLPGVHSKVKIAPTIDTFPKQGVKKASTSAAIIQGADNGYITNASQLTGDATPSSESDFARFNVSNVELDEGFRLSNFGFNIPSNATITTFIAVVNAKRGSDPGVENSSTELTYVFVGGNGDVLVKISNSFQAEGPIGSGFSSVLMNTNSPLLTPSFVNGIEWQIYWRSNLQDTETGATGNTTTFESGDVTLAGEFGSLDAPTLVVQYITIDHRKVTIKTVL